MTTSCTDTTHPYYEQISKLDFKSVPTFFTGENSFRLAHVSLGEVLDFISFGGMNYVVWRLNQKELTRFIKKWIDSQQPRINLKRIPTSEHSYRIEEESREYSYVWNRFKNDEEETLPFINLNSCPSDESHIGRIKDQGGKVRCAHVETEWFKPSFLKSYSYSFGGPIHFYEEEPEDPSFIDDNGEKTFLDEEMKEYLIQIERFEEEEPSVEVRNSCYSIISDTGRYLSLEMILSRLKVGDGRDRTIAFPFSGFTLANFVKAWWNQAGERKYFLRKNEEDFFRVYPNFIFHSSED